MRPYSPEYEQRRLSRRVLLVGGLQAAAFTGIIARLSHLQFVHQDTYRTLSEENRIQLKVVAPVRGVLSDRAGISLAENQINYRLFVRHENRRIARDSLRRAAKLLALSDEQSAALELQLKQTPRHRSLLIKERLAWEEVVRIEFHIPDLPGIALDEGQMRHYPLGAHAAHLIGHMGRVAQTKDGKLTALDRLADFKVGKNGVEHAYELPLRGKAGRRELEVNAKGMVVRELSYRPFEAGRPIQLTIDARLQSFAAQRLGEQSGSVVVMDTTSGDVLCCASMPAFDPNIFSRGISESYWESLRTDERNPLLNKAISGLYPPASTFKMIVALAGLEAGVIGPKTSIYCPGHYQLGNRRFNCWKAGGHGHVDMNHALAESCDTFFYTIAERIGIDDITAMARRFGFGDDTGLGLLGEKSGLLPSDKWKRRVHDTPWVKGDTINASIGQGFVLATPMQLAVMMARLCSGKRVLPRLQMDAPPPEFAQLPGALSHLELMHEGMISACNAKYGTAYGRRIAREGFEMAGKTGTAQVRKILQRGYDQSKLPYTHRHHGLFVGYAPMHDPRYVVSVVIDHGGGGSSAAAPVARDVLLKVQELMG